ncbi:head maturation protease, ClpP-related [Microbulbifer sp. 2205BS26-8]|uniref:head maturation protease, ClpP-related n=1 Tax=Microbulbifer sp. 2205BS26-8 TaxID=3064386 RepID=UPI00273F8A48|nr:head maturation protease, ClpP-related [Microbulbifer sp. 2205BS26-8]MDP5210002.1 Clp protease ClpP [Microbulbifer sp. 2205BS26-8]
MFQFFIRGEGGQPHQVLIYDVIGLDYWEDSITAKKILASLAEIGDEAVLVRINCQGGTHEDGIAIYNALGNHSGEVTIRIEGYACSMATVVACAGDKVEMYETALVMLHRASLSAQGNVNELRTAVEELEKADQSMATAYSRKTGKTVEGMLALLDEQRDTWLNPEEAKTLGLVDEIIVPQKFTALLNKEAVTALATGEGAAILGNLQPPETVKTALAGVPGAVAFRVDGKTIEAIKDGSKPSEEPGSPPVDGPPTDETPDPEEEEETPLADPPADPIRAERERVKAIRNQAQSCGVSADDDLIDQLIDEGVTVALAGKMLLAVKRGTQASTPIRSNHHSDQPAGGAEQVKTGWANAYKNLPGRP